MTRQAEAKVVSELRRSVGMRDLSLRDDEIDTPIGRLRLVTRGDKLCALAFLNRWDDARRALERRFGDASLRRERNPNGASERLRAYFAGELSALEELLVDTGGTPFQQRVWSAVRQIFAGQTVSYAQIAGAIGSASAPRAVGAAN